MKAEMKKFLETIRKLDQENQAGVLIYALATYTAQENTKRQFGLGLDREPPAQVGKSA